MLPTVTHLSAAGNNLHNFQTVTGLEQPAGEFGWGNGFAVMLYDDASRRQILRDEKLLNGAGDLCPDWFSVGNYFIHGTPFS